MAGTLLFIIHPEEANEENKTALGENKRFSQRQGTMYFVSQMYIKCDSLSVENREMMPCLLLAEQIKKKHS